MMARVRGVIAARTASGSRLQVTGSMSTSTGVAPSRAMHPAVAKNEYVLVMTSSPGPMPSAISTASSASVPDDTAIASPALEGRGQLALERLDLRAHDESLAVADAGDRGEDLVAKRPVLRVEVEERDRIHCSHAADVIERRSPAPPTAPCRCADRPPCPWGWCWC